jgi:alpha-D-glucose phosphate-specific phosphoglucomutase
VIQRDDEPLQAILLAGERGAPLYPLTARQPRAMLPLVGKPLIQYQLELLKKHGVSDAILCLQVMPEAFEGRFGDGRDLGMRLRYHREQTPLGTAGAVRAVADRIVGDAVLVLNGHNLTDADLSALIAFHRENNATVTMLLAPVADASRYGAVVCDADGRVLAFSEKPAVGEVATDMVNAGIYVLSRDVFRRIPKDTEFSFERQLFPMLLAEGALIYGFAINEDHYWRNIASLTDYQRAQADILEQKVMVQIDGVLVREGVWVGEGASVHPTADLRGRIFINHHTEIGRDVKIRGTVVLGSRCQIHAGALIEDAILWRGNVIESGAEVRGCILGENCVVRAGARVRPGAVLGADAVIASVVARLPSEGDVQRSGIKFGTDGWRGILADDVTVANVRLVTQAICDWAQSQSTSGSGIVIGYDTRAQSDLLAHAAAEVVAANGLAVKLSQDVCSAPALSFACRYLGAVVGIYITGSHNSAAYSGLKIKAAYGGPATPEIIGQIEEKLRLLLVSGGRAKTNAAATSTNVKTTDLDAAYLAHCGRFVDIARIAAAKLRIVIDPMHGAGAGYFSRLLEAAGISVTEVRGERNPSFGGIKPEPTEENLTPLFEAVVAQQADLGIALDGDADRLAACDASGRFVDSQHVLGLLLHHLVTRRGLSGSVVKTVSTTRLLDKIAAKHQLACWETPIGFKFLCDKMLSSDVLLAGEESGGVGVKNHLPERDGVLAGLLLLEALALSKKPLATLLSELATEFGTHCYLRRDVTVTRERLHVVLTTLQSLKETAFPGAKITRRDGTRLDFADGSWLLLRPSGTEPVVRVYAEAASVEQTEDLIALGIAHIKEQT